jgi:hypothetical protein
MQICQAFDLHRFGLTDWQSIFDVPGIDQFLKLTDAASAQYFEPSKNLSKREPDPLEWRLAPAHHVGAMTPQLLYRKLQGGISNSFVSLLPAELTGYLGDVDIVARMFAPDARHPQMRHSYQGWVVARADSLALPTCYAAAIYREREDRSDVVSIWHIGETARIELGVVWLGQRLDWSKPWHCRFNIAGRELKAKWWNYDVIEPKHWDLTGIDETRRAPGVIGFASTVHGEIENNIWGLDWYAWSLDPAMPAPLYPVETVG